MENKKRKSTGLLLSILGVVSLVLITAGVTYAFFSYAKEGQTENTLRTAAIEFVYNEIDGADKGILIENALPLTDAEGMVLGGDTQDHTTLTDNRNVFLFTITSKTPTSANIPYIVTAKKQTPAAGRTSLADGQIKLYLTASQNDGTNNTVNSGVVRTFADLKTAKPLGSDTTVFSALTGITASADEVVLYEGTVPAGQSSNYVNSFVLRMWINGDANNAGGDYSPYEFVLKTQVSGNTALSVATLKGTTGAILKSTDFYALPAATEQSPATGDGTHREDYERISYVNNSDGTIFTVSQTPADTTGYTESEQYYELSDAEFSVKVNVYANAAVYTAPSQP